MAEPFTQGDSLFDGLPGEDLIREGIADLGAGPKTIAAMLVASGRPRLLWNGLDLGDFDSPTEPERKLYALLRSSHSVDAYSQYNALMRELTSFCRGLEARLRRQA